MKTLHLLRHAKSSWDDPSLGDRDRPLAGRGRRAAARMERYLIEKGIRPDLVLCSPARRTVETLDRISKAVEGVETKIQEWIYMGSAGTLRDHVSRLPVTVDSVLVIGHNPGLEELADQLMGPGDHDPSADALREKYPTGALATLEGPRTWSELTPGSCVLRSFVRPRELEGL